MTNLRIGTDSLDARLVLNDLIFWWLVVNSGHWLNQNAVGIWLERGIFLFSPIFDVLLRHFVQFSLSLLTANRRSNKSRQINSQPTS